MAKIKNIYNFTILPGIPIGRREVVFRGDGNCFYKTRPDLEITCVY